MVKYIYEKWKYEDYMSDKFISKGDHEYYNPDPVDIYIYEGYYSTVDTGDRPYDKKRFNGYMTNQKNPPFRREKKGSYLVAFNLDKNGAVFRTEYTLYGNPAPRQRKVRMLEEITAEDGTYPDDGIQGNYWYVKKGLSNTSPRISRGNQNLGSKSSGFSESFKLYDDNLEDNLTLIVTLISSAGTRTQLLKVNNALRNNLYTAKVSDTQLKTLPLNKSHTLNISVTDGTETQNTNLTFTRTNSLPTIKIANANMGEQNKEFSFKFTPDDADGDAITSKIYIDGVQIADLGSVTRGKEITHAIERKDFITLKNGGHKIKIDVTDSNGGVSSGYIDFTKRVTWYTYEFTQEVDEMASEIRIDMLAELKTGVKIDIQVCNNALDSKPTWEKAEEGKWKRLDNSTKTAGKWAVGVKVRVDRGTAKTDSYIYGWNVSFA